MDALSHSLKVGTRVRTPLGLLGMRFACRSGDSERLDLLERVEQSIALRYPADGPAPWIEHRYLAMTWRSHPLAPTAWENP